MARSESNPPNRFERLYREWEVEPPAASIQVIEDPTRNIIAENDSPDVGFRFSVNPYRGCTHACAYCYARPSHEYLGYGAGTDFDSKIVYKPKAPDLLREALEKPSWQGDLIAFSGDTDCYQPLEAHYRLTRGCLEVCRDVGNPIEVITKSYLVSRDRDLLAELAREKLAGVCMSIPFLDEELARAIEPGAPRPVKRFEAMKLLAEAGVPVTLLVAPIIPGLNDDQIPGLLEKAREAGASNAGYVLLRLPGAVREVFLSRLREKLPLRAGRVEARLRDTRGGALSDPRFGHRMTGTGVYWEAIARSFELHRKRLGLVRDDLIDTHPRKKAVRLRRPGQLALFAEPAEDPAGDPRDVTQTDAFGRWIEALAERHLADLRFPEVRRGLQALSSIYVERGDRLARREPLDGAGKRAAFALFYGPLHFLLVREVVRALGASASTRSTRIFDLGCGTGAAGAAYALAMRGEAAGAPAIEAVDRLPWALEEARRTYRHFGLPARLRRGDLDREALPRAAGSAILCAFAVNELEPGARDRLEPRLLAAARAGAAVLVLEPLARGAAPWWPAWTRSFTAAGGRADEWRFPLVLPELIARLDRAAGLDHREITGRSLWLDGSGVAAVAVVGVPGGG